MTAFSSQPSASIASPEKDPFDPSSWKVLLERVKNQKDTLSEKSLEVIVFSLEELGEKRLEGLSEGKPWPAPNNQVASALVRLSRSYNNPGLLKEIGIYFFRDYEMPVVAQRYFERALRVGGREKEISPLLEAAAIAIQNAAALKEHRPAQHTGVTEAKARRPALPDAIRMTGKITKPTAPKLLNPPRTGILPALPETTVLAMSSEECLTRAEEEIGNGRLRKARLLLEKANKAPLGALDMWQAWTNLGESSYNQENYVEAVLAYEQACGYRPDLMTCHFNLGLAHHMNGEFNEALICYHRADRIEQNNPKVWCNLGALYFQMDEYRKAELALQKSIAVQPDYARAWDNLAATYGAQNKIDEAFEACLKSIAYNPSSTESHYKLGAIHFTRGDWKPAEDSFILAKRNPVLQAPCYCYLSLIKSTLGELREAEDYIRGTQEVDGKCELLWLAWNSLGVGLSEIGLPDKALVAYSAAQVLRPDEPEIAYNIGVSYQLLHNSAEAVKSYEQCVEYQPYHVAAWHNLGLLYAEQKQHENARRAFATIIEFAPDNMQAWYDLAICLHQLKRHEEAQAAFTRASELALTVAQAA